MTGGIGVLLCSQPVPVIEIDNGINGYGNDDNLEGLIYRAFLGGSIAKMRFLYNIKLRYVPS